MAGWPAARRWRRPLSKLPVELVIRDFEPALIGLFAEEIVGDEPGQAAVIDRLLDLLVVRCVRTRARDVVWTLGGRPGRTRAPRHRGQPEHPWTVESLATRVGLSRAALARRFVLQMGEPPLTYLTRWRLALAADLLVSTDHTLAAIASKVGYANAFALSAAFKRVHGESPRDYRSRHAAC